MKRHQHTYFVSDHHFCHRAIIDMCNRPFADIDEMDNAMIADWNSVVRKDDVVWHLGDFAYRGHPLRMRSIFDSLNGTKNLVVGNHDKKPTFQLGWAEITPFKHLVVDGIQVNLMHYAMRTWPGKQRGSLMLYGHSHGKMPGSRQSIDVGVDAVGYVPQTLEELRARMALLPRVSYDTGTILEDIEPAAEPANDEERIQP